MASVGQPDLLQPREVRAGAFARLRASERLHALVPTSLALRLTDALYRSLARVRPGRQLAARAGIAATAPVGTPSAEIERLARAGVAAQARGWELYYRPKKLSAIPIDGLEHLQRAIDAGAGVQIAYAHHGPELAWITLRTHTPFLAVLGDWIAETPPDGYTGLQVEQRRSLLRRLDVSIVHAAGSAAAQFRTLKAGGVVISAIDVPGRRTTRFLDRDVEMDDAASRLAHKTGAAVVPATVRGDGLSWRVVVHPALLPASFESASDLHQAVATVLEGPIAVAPEQYANPLRTGMWTRADDHAWYR